MLIAAMVLGLVVGIGEVFGGVASVVDGGHVGRWISLIPLGVVAAVGGFWPVRKPVLAAALLLSSAIGNFVVGVAVEDMYVLFLPTTLLVLAGAFIVTKKWGGLERR